VAPERLVTYKAWVWGHLAQKFENLVLKCVNFWSAKDNSFSSCSIVVVSEIWWESINSKLVMMMAGKWPKKTATT